MRDLVVSLDGMAALTEGDAAGHSHFDIGAAATLAQLAGANGVRVTLREDLRPLDESDVRHLRRVARGLDLRIPVATSLLKPVLEARPDRVVLGGESFDCSLAPYPLDLRMQSSEVQGLLRSFDDAGIPCVLLVPPEIDAVKAAHSLGAQGVDLFTAATLDLPQREQAGALEALGDAVRLANKLHLEVGLAGSIDAGSARRLLEFAPSAERIVVGRALLGRALLVGMDRAVRDLCSHLA